MTYSNHPLQRPPLASAPVASGIRQASRATKVDFGLLMAEAQQESGFRPDAKAKGSSATGLFQFIAGTWLGLVQRFGDKYGIGALARQVSSDGAGRPIVVDAMARQRILELRKDAKLSAALAAEQTRLYQRTLGQALGRQADNAELYLAHFLGAGGATAFLRALERNGTTPAAPLMPEAATANRSVFFDDTGRARSLGEIYDTFAQRIDAEAARFAKARPESAGDAPAFMRGVGFSATRLSPPIAAMLSLFTLTALAPPSDHPAPRTPTPTPAPRRAG
jgi:hypothetical protein